MPSNLSHPNFATSARIVDLLDDLTQSAGHLSEWLGVLLNEYRQTGEWDKFSGSVDAAYQRIQSMLGPAPDIVLRPFTIGPAAIPALLAYVSGQVNTALMDRDLYHISQLPVQNTEQLAAALTSQFLTVGQPKRETQWPRMLPAMLSGRALLFMEGVPEAWVLDTAQPPAASISPSVAEPSLKGPQEAFSSVLETQMDQLRRRIPDPGMQFELFTIGTQTHTKVLLIHMAGVVNPAIVGAVKSRLKGIRRAAVHTSNDIAEYLGPQRWTIFPQVRFSDRVDLVARNLCDGKVAVLTANDPTALILPNTLMDFFQTTQDYALPWSYATLTRTSRFVGLAIGLFLMPLYIALSSVNADLFPVQLLLTAAGSRLGIPFPPITEVIIMWGILEILIEAANRLPQQMATTIGIIGAVVVGTAIVKAGLIDSIMIVVATLSALSLFTIPALELAATMRWLFWLFVVSSSIFGVFGLLVMIIIVLAHLATMENYGVPYLSPFGPLRIADLKDSLIRFPMPRLRKRPIFLRTIDPGASDPLRVKPKTRLLRRQREVR